MELLDKLRDIQRRFSDLEGQLGDPSVMADMKRFVKINRDYRGLEPVVKASKALMASLPVCAAGTTLAK